MDWSMSAEGAEGREGTGRGWFPLRCFCYASASVVGGGVLSLRCVIQSHLYLLAAEQERVPGRVEVKAVVVMAR